MAATILVFPAANSHRPLQPKEFARLSRSLRIHLCDRTPCERTAGDGSLRDRAPGDRTDGERSSRPLDLASQVGLTVSHVNRRIAEQTARERQRRHFDPSDDTPDISA